jgi:hypothetical protein
MRDIEFLGTTTLGRMVSAVYGDEPFNCDVFYSECQVANAEFEKDPSSGEKIAYIYYHRKSNETIMTTIEGDICGFYGSSAGFSGKIKL